MGDAAMPTILWDNDGVLVDTEGLYFDACRAVLAGVDIPLEADQFKEISLRQGRSVFVLATERGISADEIVKLRIERDRLYADALRSDPRVVDGADDVLESLYGRFRMGVVTSSRREHFEIAHARSGLTRYLDFVVANEDYPRSKPHPDGYLTALRRYGLRRDDCIAVEDSERGLAAATSAGLACLIVAQTDLAKDGAFHGARRVLGSIREVPDEVARWVDRRE